MLLHYLWYNWLIITIRLIGKLKIKSELSVHGKVYHVQRLSLEPNGVVLRAISYKRLQAFEKQQAEPSWICVLSSRADIWIIKLLQHEDQLCLQKTSVVHCREIRTTMPNLVTQVSSESHVLLLWSSPRYPEHGTQQLARGVPGQFCRRKND